MSKCRYSIVASAISVGSSQQAPLPGASAARAKAGEGSPFADLINMALGEVVGRTAPANAPSAQPATGLVTPDSEAASPVADLLSALLEKLAALATDLDEDRPFSEQDLAELGELLAQFQTVMPETGALPALDLDALETLSALAARLGVPVPADADPATGTLDALAGLATKLSGELREQNPALAARLNGFAARLDDFAVEIAASQPVEATPDMRKRLIESETRPSPTTAIGANPDAEPGTTEASRAAYETAQAQAAADKSASREQAQPNAPAKPAPNAAPAAAPQQAPITTDPTANTETPDGLTISAQQPAQASNVQLAARPEAAAYHRPDPQINLPYVAVEIARHIQNGINRFEIRLNPPELGRIDVRMEIDASGNLTARLAVEKSETLDLLQRDQRALERALADAGVDPGKTELEFSLQQHGQQDKGESERQHWRADGGDAGEVLPANASPAAPGQLYRGFARLDAVNLWV